MKREAAKVEGGLAESPLGGCPVAIFEGLGGGGRGGRGLLADQEGEPMQVRGVFKRREGPDNAEHEDGGREKYGTILVEGYSLGSYM